MKQPANKATRELVNDIFNDSKEGLHTQQPSFETLHIGLATDDEDCQLINEQGEEILIIKSYPLKENAEKIMQAVNERKALLDAKNELVDIIETLMLWGRLKDGKFEWTGSEERYNEIKNIVNNAKNI